MSYNLKRYAENLLLETLAHNDLKAEIQRAKMQLALKQKEPNNNEVLFYTESELKGIISDKESLLDAKKESIKLLLKHIKDEL